MEGVGYRPCHPGVSHRGCFSEVTATEMGFSAAGGLPGKMDVERVGWRKRPKLAQSSQGWWELGRAAGNV